MCRSTTRTKPGFRDQKTIEQIKLFVMLILLGEVFFYTKGLLLPIFEVTIIGGLDV